MMKKQSILALITLSIILASCSNGVVGFKPEGEADGLPFSASNLNLGTMTFGSGPYYNDANGVNFPVDAYGCLTAPKNGMGYFPPANPAILFANSTVNAGLGSIKTYNVGGFEYEATFRLTDETVTEQSGTSSVNEPQGVILTAVWVDANKNPTGSIMLMCFTDNSFPIGTPKLEENVILVMNYHEPEKVKTIAHLIACADVPEMKASQHAGSPLTTDFHKARLIVGSDAVVNQTTGKLIHGPSISCFIDNRKVIEYKNTGSAHSITAGRWDSTTSVFIAGDFDIATSVLNISNTAPAYYFNATRGVSEYNNAWNNLVCFGGDPKAIGSLLTFGIAFQIGRTGATVNNIKPPLNATFSPQVKNISIKAYPAS